MQDIKEDMQLVTEVGHIEVTVPEKLDEVTFTANTSTGSMNIFGDAKDYISHQASAIVSMFTEIGNIIVKAQ